MSKNNKRSGAKDRAVEDLAFLLGDSDFALADIRVAVAAAIESKGAKGQKASELAELIVLFETYVKSSDAKLAGSLGIALGMKFREFSRLGRGKTKESTEALWPIYKALREDSGLAEITHNAIVRRLRKINKEAFANQTLQYWAVTFPRTWKQKIQPKFKEKYEFFAHTDDVEKVT